MDNLICDRLPTDLELDNLLEDLFIYYRSTGRKGEAALVLDMLLSGPKYMR